MLPRLHIYYVTPSSHRFVLSGNIDFPVVYCPRPMQLDTTTRLRQKLTQSNFKHPHC